MFSLPFRIGFQKLFCAYHILVAYPYFWPLLPLLGGVSKMGWEVCPGLVAFSSYFLHLFLKMIWWLIPVSAAAASWCRLQNGMRGLPRAGAGAGKRTNELVVSLNVFISHPADKQSPGARETTHFSPLSELLRTLNKEGHFNGGTLFQRGGHTPGQGIFLGNATISSTIHC